MPGLIVFIGTVGSGKSTQMRLLRCELEKRNHKVKLSFLKRGHYIVNILEVLLAQLFTSNRGDAYPIARLVEENPCVLKKLFKLWTILDIYCVYLKFLLDIYIPFKMGFTVIIEEYVPATIADYLYLTKAMKQSPERLTWVLVMLLRLLPLCEPTEAIYLDANDKVLRSRWAERGSLSEKSNYVKMQRTLMPSLLNSMLPGHVLHLDTTESTVNETGMLILSHLLDS